MVADPCTRDVQPWLERSALDRFKGVNDLVFARNGDLYFTDQCLTGLHDPTGALYRLRSNGQLDKLLGNIPSPNSIHESFAQPTSMLTRNLRYDSRGW